MFKCSLVQRELSAAGRTEELNCSNFSGAGLPAWRGRCPLGVPFERAKGTKTRLGRSPLRTPPGVRDWECVKAMFGPLPLLWLLFLPLHQATMAAGPMAGWFSRPGLSWRSGVAAAGSQAIGSWEQLLCQGKALEAEECTSRGVGANHRRASHLCDSTSPRAEQRRTHTPTSTAGWIPQGGGRPRLWRFFRLFLIAEKETPSGARTLARLTNIP